jgi:hypothetical protein
VGTVLEIRTWLTGPLPGGWRCLVLTHDGAWRALGEDGAWSPLELVRVLRVTPSMIRLRLRPSNGGHGCDLELAADALPETVHRRLRVRLAWFPRTAAKVGRIQRHSSA